LYKLYTLTRSFSATLTQCIYLRFSNWKIQTISNTCYFISNSNRLAYLSTRSYSLFIKLIIMHFYLLCFKQFNHEFFHQCPGANESPPLKLTTFSARVNVMLFSIINGYLVDKRSSGLDQKHPLIKTMH